MTITISQGNTPFAGAAGSTIVIDVLRAATTAHYLFQQNIKDCRLVADREEALSLKAADVQLIGESGGLKIEGFDFGNSPTAILAQGSVLRGQRIVFLTSNGTRALLNNYNPQGTFLVGLVNARVTAQYLRAQGIASIHLIASHPTSDDDLACADYLRSLLLNEKVDLRQIVNRIKESESAEKFYRQPELFPPHDLHLATQEDHPAGYLVQARRNIGVLSLETVHLAKH